MVSNNKDKEPLEEDIQGLELKEEFKEEVKGPLPPALCLDSFPCVEEALRVTDEFCDQYRALRREVEILQEENNRLRRMLEYYSIPITRPPPPLLDNNESLRVLVQNCQTEKLKLKEIFKNRRRAIIITTEGVIHHWILLEKAPSGHHISEDQQLTEFIRNILFFQKTKPAKRRGREGRHGPPIGRRGPRPGRAALWGGGPQPPLAASPSRTSSSRKPKARGIQRIDTAASAGRRDTREKRALRRAGNSLPEGEIIAIVTVIELDIIGIIIIISIIYTAISTAAPRHRCNI
ncbi:hypothetical protein QYE76_041893 [Lolium multiflorum]|uniref:Uncharacterized protein n=1 Tax=Lolium multiflorum TaxID=4521 RepID=A0AAD8WUE7_LOLMU|nr:hypothetical protein QYE76_041893 [Lolium multiflorum]